MYTIKKVCWPVRSLNRTANTKLAHPMGCLHTNYIKNNTLENSRIQQDIVNKKESDHTIITYNDTGLHFRNLTLKCSSVTEKSHYWTNVPIAQRFTALTLATAPLTVKTPDMN